MKILVLGGTGAMGKPIVNILAERGWKIYVTTRKKHVSDNPNIVYIQGDVHNRDFTNEILKDNYDAIIDFMIYSPDEFQYQSSLFLEKTRQYVFLSSARVYADAGNEIITEKSPRLLESSEDEVYLKTNEYALAKAREEDILLNGEKKNFTIIRPYITYNDERLQLGILEKETWLSRALRGKTIVFSKDIAEKVTTLTYGYDVALRIADLIGKEYSLGEVYHIATSNSIQWKEVLEIYLNTLETCIGKRPNIIVLDKCDWYSCKIAPYQLKYDRLFDRRFSDKKIVSNTNDNEGFLIPQKGLKMCLENFLKGERKFLGIDWKREGAFDRITGDKEPLKNIAGMKNKLRYILYRYFVKGE